MVRILIVNTAGAPVEKLIGALAAEGWDASVAQRPGDGLPDADAVVLVADAAGLATAIAGTAAIRKSRVPLVLATDLDRSGWDRTLGSAEALDVDALFSLPIDTAALVERLRGILASRAEAGLPAPSGMPAIVDRAIANEEAAAAFYRLAARAVTDPATREALLELARDEDGHKRLLEAFEGGDGPLPEGAASGGSLAEHLAAPAFSPAMSPADAFLLAARKERIAVEFYEKWAGFFPPGPQRELLLGLASVERKHKARVEAMFSNAAFPEAW